MPTAKKFFTQDQKNEIAQAISEAELTTSGEIRVHIENKCPGDVLDRAAYIFKHLNMHKTQLRNGVLFYLAINSKKFAILGDKGINAVVPENFWDRIKKEMQNHFEESRFTQGLVEGIKASGNALKEHFPYQEDDENELSNDISFGK
ncbi:MAG: TPM domain-containing protein [Bacteroidales bacterium]|nr:TPM domain-containing protein [Bacteroidales bacterium]